MLAKAILFSAPSGSGKTTLVSHLLKRIPSLQFSISATTRPPRSTEKHGKDYYFLSMQEFDSKISADAFLEWEEVYEGVKYGTLTEEIERIQAQGKIVIFDVDVVGAINIKKKLGDKAFAVFVRVPDLKTLEKRLKSRGIDDEESLKKRIEKAEQELLFEPKFDVTVINDNLEQATKRAEELVLDFISL